VTGQEKKRLTVFSFGRDITRTAYGEDARRRKYERLKLGGGQAYKL
jgi:hypothetical protein